MTALTVDRDTLIIAKPTLKGYPVLNNTTIYKGSMVCIDSTGYAVPAADTSGFSGVIGVADEQVASPSTDSDGDKKIRIRSGEIYDFVATSITQAMLGTVMYVVDDQTFDDAAGATNEIAAGILVEYISSSRGKIFVPTVGMNVDIPNLSVGTNDIVDDAVTAAKIADGAIDAAAKLDSDVVTTAKILNANVTTAKIADLGVTNAKLAAGGPGFVAGEGGAVTQDTDATTGVTLNQPTGQITTVALTTAAAADEEFTLTDSEIAATDIVVVSTTYTGGGTPAVSIKGVAAGACVVNITNLHVSAALDAVVVINFAVIKGVAA